MNKIKIWSDKICFDCGCVVTDFVKIDDIDTIIRLLKTYGFDKVRFSEYYVDKWFYDMNFLIPKRLNEKQFTL